MGKIEMILYRLFILPFKASSNKDYVIKAQKGAIYNLQRKNKELNDSLILLRKERHEYFNEITHLNIIIELYKNHIIPKTPRTIYLCEYCGFEGMEYRDFCPGCDKDSTGLTKDQYKSSS